MNCRDFGLKSNKEVKQLFIMAYIHLVAAGIGSNRRYYDTWTSGKVHDRIHAGLTSISMDYNPILVCIELLKFRSTKFCFADKFGTEHVSSKYNTKEFLKIVAKNYSTSFNFNRFKQIIRVKLTQDEVKKILMETSNFLFYSAYTTGYGTVTKTLTTPEVEKLLNITIKNGTKITGKSQEGLFEVIQNVKGDVAKCTDISKFTKIYDTLKKIKGYTIWVRSNFIKLLLEEGVNDPNRLETIKELLKKETSKRVWYEFKETVLSKIHVIENEWDYKKRKYITNVKTEDMQAILDFMTFVDKKPKMDYLPYGRGYALSRVSKCIKNNEQNPNILEWKSEEINEIKPVIKKEEEGETK